MEDKQIVTDGTVKTSSIPKSATAISPPKSPDGPWCPLLQDEHSVQILITCEAPENYFKC